MWQREKREAFLNNEHRRTDRQTLVVSELVTFSHSSRRERKPEPNQNRAKYYHYYYYYHF